MIYSMRPDDIRYADIEKLISDSYPEGIHLDYKKTYAFLDGNGNKDESRVKFAVDVAAFANADGGCLVIGVTDNSGVPGRIVGDGSSLNDVDVTSQLTKIANDNLDPKTSPNVRIVCVHSEDKNTRAIVVRVEPSARAPHQVFSTGIFPIRRGSDTKNMTVRELQEAFLVNERWAERIKHFRAERLANRALIEATGQLNTSVLVAHLVPFADIRRRSQFDLGKVNAMTVRSPTNRGTHVFETKRFNLEGLAFISPGICVVQFFRDGSVELTVAKSWFFTESASSNSRLPRISFVEMENCIRMLAKNYPAICADAGANYPFSLSTCVLNGSSLQVEPFDVDDYMRWRHQPHPTVDRDNLPLVDVLLEAVDQDVDTTIKPTLDSLWQSVGYKRSPSYSDEGKWNR